MRVIIVQQKISKAIEDIYPETMTDDQQFETDELVYTSIILHQFDAELRKVGQLNSTKELWERLEELYLVKSLPNKPFLLEKFLASKLILQKVLMIT